MLRKGVLVCLAVMLMFAVVPNAGASDDALAKKLHEALVKGPAEGNFQVKADEVAGWIEAKKDDFLVVDVRPNAQEYKNGRIPGSIYIPYNQMLSPDTLKKLPKDKKIILVCVTGQTQNLPVVALRALGYNARVMSFGYVSWIPGYHGGGAIKAAQDNAAAKKFPIEK